MNNITLLDALTLLFIGLKLSGNIDWSWWLVLMPMYGGFIFCVIIGTITRVKEKEKRQANKNDFKKRMRQMMEKAERENKINHN